MTRQPIPNVEFKVTYADGRPVDTMNGKLSSNGQYFTDSNGEIHITGVTGTLAVTEEKTADNYTMDAANRSQTVIIHADDGQTLTFFDAPAQNLTVQLYVKGTSTPIPGAKFLLTDGSGAKIGNDNGEFVTDENGRFSLSGLKPGVTVKVKQISSADGYLIDGAAKTITIKTGDEQTVTVYNSPKQTLIVRLYVKDTTTPIQGAKFLLRDSGGTLIGENNGVFMTDKNGEFSVANLTPGVTITAAQTDTVSGYVLDESPQSVLIKSGDAQSMVFYNAPKGALIVRKIDAATEKPLPGAEFKIVTINGNPADDNEGKTSTNGVYKTDENGEITLLKLAPGAYTVTETKAPDGYILDSQPQTVTVNADDKQTLIFRDNALQTLTIQLYVTDTTDPIPGAAFLVRDSGGAYIGPEKGRYVTDQNGQIVIDGLEPGVTVIARQTGAVSGYVFDSTPQNIQIQSGAAQTLTFYNGLKSSLTIRKLDAATEKPLPGAEFKITDTKGEPADQDEGKTSSNGIYRTDENGQIVLTKLRPGLYRVAETKAPDGYVLDNNVQTVMVNINDAQTLTFRDNPLQSVTIQKYEDGTTKPLSGVVFLVTDADGNRIGSGEYITDANGQIVISGLEPGAVLVAREIRAVRGYVLNGTPQTIRVGNGANTLLSATGAVSASGAASGNTLTF